MIDFIFHKSVSVNKDTKKIILSCVHLDTTYYVETTFHKRPNGEIIMVIPSILGSCNIRCRHCRMSKVIRAKKTRNLGDVDACNLYTTSLCYYRMEESEPIKKLVLSVSGAGGVHNSINVVNYLSNIIFDSKCHTSTTYTNHIPHFKEMIDCVGKFEFSVSVFDTNPTLEFAMSVISRRSVIKIMINYDMSVMCGKDSDAYYNVNRKDDLTSTLNVLDKYNTEMTQYNRDIINPKCNPHVNFIIRPNAYLTRHALSEIALVMKNYEFPVIVLPAESPDFLQHDDIYEILVKELPDHTITICDDFVDDKVCELNHCDPSLYSDPKKTEDEISVYFDENGSMLSPRSINVCEERKYKKTDTITETLTLLTYEPNSSSAFLVWKNQDGKRFYSFLSDSIPMLLKCVNGTMSGTFRFVKRNTSIGIKLV